MPIKSVIIRSNQVCPDSRVEKEAAALIEYGHGITILSWDRRADYKTRQEQIDVFGFDVPIIRFGHKAEFGAGFKNLKSYLLFQKDLFRWLIRNKEKYDVIHACDFDTAFTSTIANLFLRKKIVFDIFDYIGGERRTLFQKIICRLQNWIINQSSATIICTEERRKQIKKSHPHNLVIIHNSPPQISELNAAKHKEGITKVCYVGILQDYRLLKEMPEFFINHPNFELHIGGFGKYEEFYKKLSYTYKNIIYYGSLQYQDTLKLENECDIMLAIYDPTIENHIFAAPNKFYEGLMLGKPLIMVKGTGMSYIVEQYHIGETIEYSAKGFELGVLELSSRREEWPEISKKMKEIYNDFSWNEMKTRLDALYKKICYE